MLKLSLRTVFTLSNIPSSEEKKEIQKNTFKTAFDYINSAIASLLSTVNLPPIHLQEPEVAVENIDINITG